MLYKTISGSKLDIPEVSGRLCICDKLGMAKMRLNIGRMAYRVKPGLYALGNPGSGSPVFVSANYKYSFDLLRQSIGNLDGWILVLDTHGINVWCAAGKGTFGTEELVRQITVSGLNNIVSHRELIVPQLGAPGVAAHKIRKQTGFKVIYGPVNARDIQSFIEKDYQAAESMRKVSFSLKNRLMLIPVEVSIALKYIAGAILLFFLFSLFRSGFSPGPHLWQPLSFLAIAFVTGTMIVPVLLPYIPGRPFAVKGFLVNGLVTGAILTFIPAFSSLPVIDIIAWLLITSSIASFFAMNFTGSTTYTSLSGVRKELRYAAPMQIGAFASGFLIWVIHRSIAGMP